MHAIQTSGESIRNISADQYAGDAADEICDPRPWAELIRQATTFHPEFSYLSRKFKIAVISAAEDRAALRWHDCALRIVRDGAGERSEEYTSELLALMRTSYTVCCLKIKTENNRVY